jgi:hypothetical protein
VHDMSVGPHPRKQPAACSSRHASGTCPVPCTHAVQPSSTGCPWCTYEHKGWLCSSNRYTLATRHLCCCCLSLLDGTTGLAAAASLPDTALHPDWPGRWCSSPLHRLRSHRRVGACTLCGLQVPTDPWPYINTAMQARTPPAAGKHDWAMPVMAQAPPGGPLWPSVKTDIVWWCSRARWSCCRLAQHLPKLGSQDCVLLRAGVGGLVREVVGNKVLSRLHASPGGCCSVSPGGPLLSQTCEVV